MPEIYEKLTGISKSIEKKNKDIQGIEFVIENGRLWILYICNSSKSPEVLIRMLVEMEKENIITKREAILSVNPASVITTKTDEYFYTFLSWLDELKTINVGANIVHRKEVHNVIRYDADLVGLFRTECLLPVSENVIDSWVYKLVNAKSREERQAAVLPLKKIQYDDYYYMLKVLSGKIFVLRLQDYPLFMFLPLLDEFTKAVIERKVNGQSLENDEVELEFLNKIYDTNSMLGLRGCRLGISYPELFEMQLEAIFEASCDLINEGCVVKPYIMSSFVSCAGEVKYFKELVEKTAEKVMTEKGVHFEYKFGTMIEIPRAALTSDEISPYVDFFSYGTNDLTQMTYGVSRTESVFDKFYLKMGIVDFNPFNKLDTKGVGQLIKLSMQKGKQSNKNLTCGICGIQSREIHSVKDALDLGFDYISIDCNCIPQAKLISAQLALLKNS